MAAAASATATESSKRVCKSEPSNQGHRVTSGLATYPTPVAARDLSKVSMAENATRVKATYLRSKAFRYVVLLEQ
jgi:hypothetical protein